MATSGSGDTGGKLGPGYTVAGGTTPRMVDFYAVLGVRRGAGVTDLQQAWRRQAAACHPDRMIGEEPGLVEWARRRWSLLDAAIGVLTAAERDRYDRALKAWTGALSYDGGVGPKPATEIVIDLRAGCYLAGDDGPLARQVDLVL